MKRAHRRGQSAAIFATLVAMAWVSGAAVGDGPMPGGFALDSAPLQIFDKLVSSGLGDVPRMSDAERALLHRSWEFESVRSDPSSKPDEALLIDAMLFASGIEGQENLAKYRAKFHDLAAHAVESLKASNDDRGRGEALMRFLHSDVLRNGYDEAQTTFSGVFDTGKYNCVSSTAIYDLVGRKVGLRLSAISIPGNGSLPGHAALDLIDGNSRYEVEPTNPDGFDWQAKISRPGVTVIGFIPNRKESHMVDELGIASMIASNRGVDLDRQKPPRRLEAVRCYLTALALDPRNQTATKNLLAIFTNWGPELMREGHFEEAVRTLAFGLSFSPGSSSLKNNLTVVWTNYIQDTLRKGQDLEAMSLLERASRAMPGDPSFEKPSRWFRRLASEDIDRKDWEAGLRVIDRGCEILSGKELEELRDERIGIYRRWSQSLLEQRDVRGSMKVLAHAHAMDPDDRGITSGIAYHTQEALAIEQDRAGLDAALEHFRELRARFPKVKEVAQIGDSFALRAVLNKCDSKEFEEALALAAKCRPVFEVDEGDRLTPTIYDRWAGHLASEKRWKESLEKYAEGLRKDPKNDLLSNNSIVMVDRWAAAPIQAKEWSEAVKIYEVGLTYFPDNGHLRHNKSYCESQMTP